MEVKPEAKQDAGSEPKDELKLTDREIAIARGENPDAAVTQDTDETTTSPESSTEAVSATDGAREGQPATDEQSHGSGKEAAGSTPATAKAPWYKDEHRELAASYGLTDDDLKALSGEDEFRRTTRLFDRQLASFQPNHQAAAQQPPKVDNLSQVGQQPAGQPTGQQGQSGSLQKIDIAKLKAENYDETAIGMAERVNAALEIAEQQAQYVAQMQQQMAQAGHAQRIAAFHDAVDSLGDPRYGKSIGNDGRVQQLNKDADEARRKLYETADTLAYGIVARAQAAGQQPQLPPMNVLLKRAHQLAFGEDIRQEERRSVQQQITEQSKRRRAVAVSRDTSGKFASPKREFDNPTSAAKEIANNPAVMELWNKFQEANGAAA